MKKLLTGILGLAIAIPLFASGNAHAVEVIDELDISSPLTSIHEGPLYSFGADINNEHLSIEPYGSNTHYLQRPQPYDSTSWQGFGDEEPYAHDDGTLYALRLTIQVESDEYEISDHPSIIFNGNNFTEIGYTTFEKYSWGGYAIIDLGQVAPEECEEEPTFKWVSDFNDGATYKGQEVYTREMVAFVPAINEPNLVSCFEYNAEYDSCIPIDVKKGKELAYVTINGERYEVGDESWYEFNKDTTVKYFWNDVNLEDYTVEDEAGNSVTFEEEEGHTYELFINAFSFNMTEEELAEMGIPVEDYEEGKAATEAATEGEGELLAYLEIEIYDEDDRPVHEGPFNVRIKLPEEFKGFKYYKFIYLTDDFEAPEEAIWFTLDDEGYLNGTLEHLSGYALLGTNTGPAVPDTGAATKSSANAILIPSIIGVVAVLTTIAAFLTRKYLKETKEEEQQ